METCKSCKNPVILMCQKKTGFCSQICARPNAKILKG